MGMARSPVICGSPKSNVLSFPASLVSKVVATADGAPGPLGPPGLPGPPGAPGGKGPWADQNKCFGSVGGGFTV